MTATSVKNFALAALAAVFAGCAQHLYLPTDFKEDAMAYPVKGRQGWMLNQTLSFAEFKTSKVKRGWTSTYSIPFLVNFEGGKEKIAFTLYNDLGDKAEVMALSKLRSAEIVLFNDFFGIPLKYENTFAGTIFSPADTAGWWNFVLLNPDESWGRQNQSAGYLLNKQGQRMEIKPINRLETKKGPSFPSTDNFGFEVWRDSQLIAAVSVVNNGEVVMRQGLAPNERLLMAALASAIMLRGNLTEAVTQQ